MAGAPAFAFGSQQKKSRENEDRAPRLKTLRSGRESLYVLPCRQMVRSALGMPSSNHSMANSERNINEHWFMRPRRYAPKMRGSVQRLQRAARSATKPRSS